MLGVEMVGIVPQSWIRIIPSAVVHAYRTRMDGGQYVFLSLFNVSFIQHARRIAGELLVQIFGFKAWLLSSHRFN